MHNIQYALTAVDTIVSVYVIHTVSNESTRVELEQQTEEERISICRRNLQASNIDDPF
jgi:hypothetical protein